MVVISRTEKEECRVFCSAFGAALIPPYVSIPVYIPPYFNSIVVETLFIFTRGSMYYGG
jgi:hypothetical protein